MSGTTGPVTRKSHAITEPDNEQLTNLFRLLSDRTRLRILLLLAHGERDVSTLCEDLALPQPTISHHLGLLRMSHVVLARREGRRIIYALRRPVDSNGDVFGIDVQDLAVRVQHAKKSPSARAQSIGPADAPFDSDV